MKVSGFTFVRDANRLRYPIIPALQSILPLCDEVIVNVGAGTDDTLDSIRGLNESKLKVFESVWDETKLAHGRVFAEQTDLALARCTGDLCLYIQADEVLHHHDHDALRSALKLMHQDPAIEGLLFDYVHLYGSFHTVGTSRRWYRREIRAFRNGLGVHAWRDSQGFRIAAPGGPRKLRVAPAKARVFHYGWVRSPADQLRKLAEFERLYGGDDARTKRLAKGFDYDSAEKVKPFTGSHPAPMQAWVAAQDWPYDPRPRALRWRHLREDLLDLFEAATGVRLGEYKNYELVR